MHVQKPSAGSIVFSYVSSGANVDVLKFCQEQGLFKKHGLNMSMIYCTTGILSIQAVVSARASAGTAPVTDTLKSIADGAPLKIIMVNIDRFDHLLVAGAGIGSPRDLKGKKIAIGSPGSFSDIETRLFLRQWGIDSDQEVQLLDLGNVAGRAAALSSGAVDGATVTTNYVSVVKKAGFHTVFDMSTTQARFANRGVVASDRLIKDQPHVVKAIVAGFVEGTRHWKANPVEAKAYLKKTYKLPDTEIDSLYSEVNRLMRSEPTPDLDSIRTAWENTPGLKARGTLDLTKFVDARFVGEVLKEIK